MENDFGTGLDVGMDYYWNERPLRELWFPGEPSEEFKNGFKHALVDLRQLLARAEKLKDPWS